MDTTKGIVIWYAIVSGLAWGALAVTACTLFFVNDSGYPTWNLTEVFITVSIMSFVLTICAFIPVIAQECQ